MQDLKLKFKKLKYSLFVTCCMLLFSCKVNYRFKGITIPPDAKSISIQMFKITDERANLTPAVEPQQLTLKLRDAVSTQTNLALLKQGGDLLFEECRIISYSTVSQSNAAAPVNGQDNAALSRLTVTIKVNFVNKLDETKNFTDKEFSRYFDYPSNQNLSQIESSALDQINRQLTEDIFNAAFNNW